MSDLDERALRAAYIAWEHSYTKTTGSSFDHLRAAILAYESARPASGEDTKRLDWLCLQHVEVRTPLVYGSRANFHASPDDVDGGDIEPSNLRAQIDANLKRPADRKGGR